MNKNDAHEVFRRVWKLFTYVSDEKNYGELEHWTSHAEAVRNNEPFSDDCDGFALTCAELLIEAGFNREDVYAIICSVETGEGHLVCGVKIGDVVYILENRFSGIYDWRIRTEYDWKLYMDFSKPGAWKIIDDGV